jgi:hypothetical protein
MSTRARKCFWGLEDGRRGLEMRVKLKNAGRGSKMQVGVQRCELGLRNACRGLRMVKRG